MIMQIYLKIHPMPNHCSFWITTSSMRQNVHVDQKITRHVFSLTRLYINIIAVDVLSAFVVRASTAIILVLCIILCSPKYQTVGAARKMMRTHDM